MEQTPSKLLSAYDGPFFASKLHLLVFISNIGALAFQGYDVVIAGTHGLLSITGKGLIVIDCVVF